MFGNPIDSHLLSRVAAAAGPGAEPSAECAPPRWKGTFVSFFPAIACGKSPDGALGNREMSEGTIADGTGCAEPVVQ